MCEVSKKKIKDIEKNPNLISKEEYIRQVKTHLAKSGKEIKSNKLTEVKDKAEKLLDELLPIISEKEAWFLQQSIKSKAIPTPKLLIKDHKDPDELNNYPTRLVVPANNFTSAFPKLGYMGIKKIFDDNPNFHQLLFDKLV